MVDSQLNRMRLFLLALVCVAIFQVAVAEDSDSRQKWLIAKQLVEAWNKTGAAKEKEQFEKSVQPLGDSFHEIKPNTVYGTNHFVKVTLNRSGVGLDGFRFKAPDDGESKQMVMMLAIPDDVRFRWWILARQGEMKPFDRAFKFGGTMHYLELAPWGREGKPYWTLIQALRYGIVEPGKEYLIWISLPDEKPVDVWIGINLHPGETPMINVTQWEKAMGFDWEQY